MFFTALLFWSLAVYLPKLAATVVGEISSMFSEGGERVQEGFIATTLSANSKAGEVADVRTATMISNGNSNSFWGNTTTGQVKCGSEIIGSGVMTSPSVTTLPLGSRDTLSANALARSILAQASVIQRSISKETVHKLKKILQQEGSKQIRT